MPLRGLIGASQLGGVHDLGEVQQRSWIPRPMGCHRPRRGRRCGAPPPWTVIRGRLRRRAPGAVTSIALRLVSRRSQSIAASRWLRTAPSPQARTAAIQCPFRSRWARPHTRRDESPESTDHPRLRRLVRRCSRCPTQSTARGPRHHAADPARRGIEGCRERSPDTNSRRCPRRGYSCFSKQNSTRKVDHPREAGG